MGIEIFANFIGYFQLAIKGLLIGIIASAPMGPVGILCIRRTMRKGRIYGFVTGIGASISDIIYAFVTGFSMTFVMNFIENEKNLFWLKLIGSIMLLVFGIWTLRSDPRKLARPSKSKKEKGTLAHNLFTGFLLTFSNPLIIFLFLATFNMFTFVIPDYFGGMCLGYASIVGGALLWWYGLTYVITKAQNNFGLRGIVRLNQSIGWVVIGFSLLYAVNTMLHLSAFS